MANVLAGRDAGLIKEFQDEIGKIFECPNLFEMSPETMAVCQQWDSFCHRLYHAYQDAAQEMVEDQP